MISLQFRQVSICNLLALSISDFRLSTTFSVTSLDLLQDNFLLVVAGYGDRRNIYQIDLRSGAMISLLTSATFDPVAVAFDPVERTVYWTDFKQKLIGKKSFDGSQRGPVIILNDPSGI